MFPLPAYTPPVQLLTGARISGAITAASVLRDFLVGTRYFRLRVFQDLFVPKFAEKANLPNVDIVGIVKTILWELL